jgi:hypothetical protein
VSAIVNFATRYGGRVTVTIDDTLHADCDGCGAVEGALISDRTEPIRAWAQDHANTCAGVPAGYIDYAAKAVEHLSLAFVHLNRIGGGHEKEMAEACLRAAEVYTQLDRNRKAARCRPGQLAAAIDLIQKENRPQGARQERPPLRGLQPPRHLARDQEPRPRAAGNSRRRDRRRTRRPRQRHAPLTGRAR